MGELYVNSGSPNEAWRKQYLQDPEQESIDQESIDQESIDQEKQYKGG